MNQVSRIAARGDGLVDTISGENRPLRIGIRVEILRDRGGWIAAGDMVGQSAGGDLVVKA